MLLSRVSEYGTKGAKAAMDTFKKIMSPDAPTEPRGQGTDVSRDQSSYMVTYAYIATTIN